MVVANGDLLILVEGTPLNPANGNPSHELVVVDGGDEHLEGGVHRPVRRGDILKNGVEEGL